MNLFRKLLHLCSVFAIIPIVLPAQSWMTSSIVCVVFAAMAWFGAKFTNMEKDINMKQRKAGEQQKSMLILFLTYAFLIGMCWGVFKQPWMVVLSVVAWGIGDCFAALIGKKFGKHKIQGRFVEGKKSVEGSLAMFITSFISVFYLYQGHTILTNMWLVALVAFWVALFATLAELFSRGGWDTFFCPFFAMLAMIVMTFAAGGI